MMGVFLNFLAAIFSCKGILKEFYVLGKLTVYTQYDYSIDWGIYSSRKMSFLKYLLVTILLGS